MGSVVRRDFIPSYPPRGICSVWGRWCIEVLNPLLADPYSVFFKDTIYLQFLTFPCKEHRHCIFMWFMFKFKHFKKYIAFIRSVFITV